LGKLNFGNRVGAVLVLCATTAVSLPAQTFTTLFSFDLMDGGTPYARLTQATSGDLYGTTAYGGTHGSVDNGGTAFKITTSGELTTLYNFCSQSGCMDGSAPGAGLVQATNGDFYGTTVFGGANGQGTVFKITPNGRLTTLYSFCDQSGCTDGANPIAGLVQSTNGDFYGTTNNGGANFGGAGTVFKITPGDTLTTLYSFCSQSGCADGAYPVAGLVQATNGDFYGTTEGGSYPPACTYSCGTVFKITPSGTLTTLHTFCTASGCPDGYYPTAALVQATNGDLYGTADNGGADAGGTVFRMTLGGALTTLYSFCARTNCTDGNQPIAGLVQATNGDLYGTTYGGGAYGYGSMFEITPSGALRTVYSLCAQGPPFCPGGYSPEAAPVQNTDGDLYGATLSGGAYGYGGSIFSLSVGLGPFVKTLPTSGKVGAAVAILGTNLTGATSVSFNGTAAAFTVASPSLITTTVPTGATTGKVEVVTPSGTLLASNVPYRVLP
jgi:uncharacterized repeat protein (TIGR03803 family)